MVNIGLIDDHKLFGYGLKEILRKSGQFELVFHFERADQYYAEKEKYQIKILLIDISLGEQNGLEVAKKIKINDPELKVVILSAHKEPFYLKQALDINSDGYINKEVDPEELYEGLRRVESGKPYYSDQVSELMHKRNGEWGLLDKITEREKEILGLLAHGDSTKEIAEKLLIGNRTVETHRANILKKFGLKNTTDLVRHITQQSLI